MDHVEAEDEHAIFELNESRRMNHQQLLFAPRKEIIITIKIKPLCMRILLSNGSLDRTIKKKHQPTKMNRIIIILRADVHLKSLF